MVVLLGVDRLASPFLKKIQIFQIFLYFQFDIELNYLDQDFMQKILVSDLASA